MRPSIANRLGIGATILVIISVGVTSWLFYNKTTEILVNEAIEHSTKQMNVTAEALSTRINAPGEDVLFLSGTPPVQGILRANSNKNRYDPKDKSSYAQWKQRLEDIFLTMLRTKPSYLKIRYINKYGKEIVVVVRENNNLTVIENEKLQNKSKRKYFRQTLRLPKGTLYLSEINLNREYGEVSLPRQEVLRSATPVFDEKTNEVAGILVITVDIGQVLHGIQRRINNVGKEVFITNDHGGYLLHPNINKAYGFDLGKRFRIQEDIPEIAELYFPENKKKQAVFRLKDRDDQTVVNFAKLYFDQSKPERFIALAITEPYSQILEEQRKLLEGIVIVSIVLAVVAVLLAIFFAYKISRPINQITTIIDDYIHDRDSTAIMPVENKDEIGVLARSYLTLIAQVEEAQKDLTIMNKRLESRVIERTHKLEQSEHRQRSIVDNMADGLIVMSDQGEVISFNKAATDIFGYDGSEVVGSNINMLMPEPNQSQHDSYLEDYKKNGVRKVIGKTREVEGLRKDGTVFPMELSVSEMLIDDRKVYTGVLRDITERKQIDKLKNEFVSTVSHELRTPLTSIRGSLGLVVGGALGEIPDSIKEMLVVAENNAKRLLLLINDILDMQKIEVGEISFRFEEMDLTVLIKDSIKENEAYANEYDVEFIYEYDLDNAYVFGDRDRLMQVMVNLLSNAVKFSPRGSVVKIRLFRKNKFLCVSVVDTGPGIPEDFQSKLFDKFTQSDSSVTRIKGGTGLGLTITKAIIERHNGKLSFKTSREEGTVFTVELIEIIPHKNLKSADMMGG